MSASPPSIPEDPPDKDSGTSSWRDLFAPRHGLAVAVMAGGIGVCSMNGYFTAALLPSIAAELDGQQLYAWASTAYLIAAVVATVLVPHVLARRGSRGAYSIAYAVLGAGALMAVVAPVMEVFVTARSVQGIGGGLLTGLGYATIRGVLPEVLWIRATGLISAMFGVGTLVGPALGGAFAELNAWRLGFGAIIAAAVVLLVLSLRALPSDRTRRDKPRSPVPYSSVVVLAATAAALSVSGTLSAPGMVMALAIGVVLLVCFFVVDARSPHGVLPSLTYTPASPLKWVYLTGGALSAGVTVEAFIPLFAQDLAGATPLMAGLLGGAPSLGWTVAQLISVNARADTAHRLVRAGPVILTGGLIAYGLLQAVPVGGWLIAFSMMLLAAAGAGIGLAFPHLSVAAISSGDDPVEGEKAAAAVSTTQLIAMTLTSALAGILLALGHGSALAAAQLVISGIAAVSAVGVFAGFAATRRAAPGKSSRAHPHR
jgi:MFS family permease